MKKLALLLTLLIPALLSSQSCLPDGIEFTTQEQIDSFQTDYPGCTEIEGYVIFNGEDITNLDSLIVLTSVEGGLNIGYWIAQNPSLISLEGLNNLTYLGGSLRIDRNQLLVDLSGLENLTSIGGELRIGTDWAKSWDVGNPSLISLKGLDNLSSIGEGISIEANNSLTSLTALNNVTSIGGGILIEHNGALQNLEGLNNINPGSIHSLYFGYNHSLSRCEIESICSFLENPDGDINIYNNAPGCNSQEEVEDACAQSVNEFSNISNLTFHPNPFSNLTTIEYELNQPTNIQITIYNHLGKQVEVIEQKQSSGKQQFVWNAEGLPAGIYFCVLKTESKTQTLKMIKLK